MRKALWLLGVLFWLPLSAQAETFSGKLSENEIKAAGLDKLTVEERAKLDELVAKHGENKGPASSASVVKGAAEKPAILNGRIAGTLVGWEEGTVLVFEDGQRWQVVSKGSYRAAPVRKSPAVELFPISNGDYVMTVNTVPTRAQVRRAPAGN